MPVLFQIKTNHSHMVSVSQCPETSLLSGGWLKLRVSNSLRFAEDLPGRGGATHVGGASVAARPCQETKAVATKQDWGQVPDLISPSLLYIHLSVTMRLYTKVYA